MKIIYYSKDDQFILTESEYIQALVAWNGGHNAFIPRLNVSLSRFYIWAGEKQPSMYRRKLHDGTYAIMYMGRWVDENDHSININMNFYPELVKDLTDDDIKKITVIK